MSNKYRNGSSRGCIADEMENYAYKGQVVEDNPKTKNMRKVYKNDM